MRQTRVRKEHIQRPTDLHEYAWAETDIFGPSVGLPSKPYDLLRNRSEWAF
jgi:hypothetical protein